MLAHELTHALEDQRFGLRLERGESDDAALARLALIEGTRDARDGAVPAALLRGREGAQRRCSARRSRPGPDLPKFLQDQLLFPYIGRDAFAQALRAARAAGPGRSSTSPTASASPDSTEQVLHPEKYLRVETPAAGALDACRWTPAGGARRAGTWGEWQTGELVGGSEAAAGLGRRPLRALAAGLRQPCRATCSRCAGAGTRARDAREFELRGRAGARSTVPPRVTASGDAVTLVWAPVAALALRLLALGRCAAGRGRGPPFGRRVVDQVVEPLVERRRGSSCAGRR